MASMSISVPVKDAGSLQKGLKRICRDRHEEAPIKKRLMAEMKLAQRLQHVDVEGDKVLDLNPALKHTLAQFTLSSRSSLGGPAAFSARTSTDKDLSLPITPAQPLPSPSILGTGPLLVPSDSSTELTYSVLEGESISSFLVGGEKRLCLPQILNSVLRDFALQQINAVCDELYVYCARCDGQQLHVLKMLGILPVNAPSCGLITQTDAQRLCNALLRPGTNPSTSAVPPVLNSDREGFRVEHWCMGRCRGVFVPRFYVHPEAPCVQCVKCRLLFTPQSFVMHSHQPPDKRTCHWGFDSAQWGRYLQLSTCYEGTAEESTLKKMLNQMKEKFSLHPEMLSCQVPNHELSVKTSSPDLSPHTDTLQREDPLAFSRLSSNIKQEVGSPAFIHPSFYLYDEMVAPNVSLQKNLVDRLDSLGTLLKHQYSRTTHDLHVTPSTIVKETKSYHGDEAHEHCHPPPTGVTTETGIKEEDDKKQLLLDMVHMYNTQQEKLSMTLHTHRQLETELQKVRDGDEKELRRLSREHGELQNELEVMHTEHAQKLRGVQQEHRKLEQRLEQFQHQNCTCVHTEEGYTKQLKDLRVRLDQAEKERQELQEELRRERHARQELQLIISQLHLQINQSTNHSPDISTPSNHNPRFISSTDEIAERQNTQSLAPTHTVTHTESC